MTEEIKSAYEKWLAQPEMPADLAEELKAIAGDEDAITDRFYRELEFGTGGLRGVIGAGTNRMNVYNIRKATQGLANYLNASDLPKKVAIGTTAVSRAMCLPAKPQLSLRQTASRPIFIPVWNLLRR